MNEICMIMPLSTTQNCLCVCRIVRGLVGHDYAHGSQDGQPWRLHRHLCALSNVRWRHCWYTAGDGGAVSVPAHNQASLVSPAFVQLSDFIGKPCIPAQYHATLVSHFIVVRAVDLVAVTISVLVFLFFYHLSPCGDS